MGEHQIKLVLNLCASPVRRNGQFQFIQQVRQETSKVTWPTRNETTVTTIMVFIMVALAAIFFFAVDSVLNVIVNYVLDFGTSGTGN